MDWNVTARLREPHVRVHVGERAMTAWLLLDVSASMTFGTADRRKADVAEGVALAVGHVATRRGNRLGVVAIGAGDPRILRPRQGRLGLLALLHELRAEPEADGLGATSLGFAVTRTAALARNRGLIVVVSDFRGDKDWEGPLRTLRARHGVLAVEIRDPREMELPPVGDLWMTDPETGRQLHVNTNKRRVRKRFAQAAAEEREEVAAALRRGGRGPPRALDRGRLAADAGRAPAAVRAARAAGGEGGVSFREPSVLIGLCCCCRWPPWPTRSCSGASAPTRPASATRRCCPGSPPRGRAGGGTCRRSSCSSRSARSSSRSRGRSARSPRRSARRR